MPNFASSVRRHANRPKCSPICGGAPEGARPDDACKQTCVALTAPELALAVASRYGRQVRPNWDSGRPMASRADLPSKRKQLKLRGGRWVLRLRSCERILEE